MKKSHFLILWCCIFNSTIFSSEKNNIKKHHEKYLEIKGIATDHSQTQISPLDWKERLEKCSPTYIELSKEQQAQERALRNLINHNPQEREQKIKEISQREKTIEILQLKYQIECNEQKITSMQTALEHKNREISQLKKI